MKRNRKQNVQQPTGLYLDARNGNVVIADYAPDGNSFEIQRAVVDERRAVNITSPHLRTVVEAASAHSQFAQISATAADTDEQIISSLLEATQQDHGLIGNFTRSPHGSILLTQADELAISKANQELENWLEAQQPTHVEKLPYALRVETRARAIARLWHATSNPSTDETVAFIVLGYDDYAVALWSHAAGFAYETEEFFEQGAKDQIKLRHACSTFARLLSANTIHDLNLPAVTRAIVSAPAVVQDVVLDMLAAERELSNIQVSAVTLALDAEPIDQPAALAIGALLDDPELPPCDLNVSLNEQLEDIQRQHAEQESSQTQSRAMRAAVALLIPIVAVAAFVFASYADRVVERARLQARLNTEMRISKQLAQENADYESSKANFAAFQSLLNNLMALRRRQPAMEQLLRDLNQRWPKEQSWFISEINVKGPSVEIKGKTRNEQAITSFAKSLEFSDGLFTNILAKNNLQGASTNPNQQAQSTSPASSIIEFTVNATYGPLATPDKQPAASETASQPPSPSLPKPPAIPLTIPATNSSPTTTSSPSSAASPQTGVTQ